ncbi:MAG: hypothetical protein ACKVUT_05415 [Gaiella sp.]
MAASDSVRIEVAFDRGAVISAMVTPKVADEVEQAVSAGGAGSVQLDTDDGRVTVVVAHVVYVKRYARDARVGFGA